MTRTELRELATHCWNALYLPTSVELNGAKADNLKKIESALIQAHDAGVEKALEYIKVDGHHSFDSFIRWQHAVDCVPCIAKKSLKLKETGEK